MQERTFDSISGQGADDGGSRPTGARGRLPKLTHAQIFKTALRIIDAEGREALTMRRLAEMMNTGTTTLYDYVRGKEEVLEGVQSLLVSDVVSDLDRSRSWDQQLIEALRRVRAVHRAHPGFVEVLTSQDRPGLRLDALRENLLRIVRQAGFSKQDTTQVIATVLSYVFGFSVTDRVWVRDTREFQRMRDLPRGDYPYLTDMAAEWAEHDPECSFEYGLTIMVEGLTGRMRQSAGASLP